MRTPSTTGLATAAIALVAVSLITRNPLFALLAFPFLTLLALGLLSRPPPLEVQVTRTLSRDRVAVGQEIAVAVTVRNLGAAAGFLEIHDRLPPTALVTFGAAHVWTALPAKGTAVLRYRFVLRVKGEVRLGPVTLRSREPLGLSFEEKIVHLEETLVAAPVLEDIRRLKVLPRRTRMVMGQVLSRAVGFGTEFWGVREHQPGDDPRAINWKAYARFDKLYTNEFQGERSADTILVLDARREADVGPGTASTVELGVRAAASLAARILHGQNRVGLVVQRDIVDWVYPGYGRKQLYRIVDHLVNVRAAGEFPFEHVIWVLARFFPRNCQIIVISPMADARATETVVTLAAYGFDVLVISPSPLEVERAMYRDDPHVDVAYRVLRLERDSVLADLRQFAPVVEWDGVRPLAAALKGVRAYPRRR